MTDNADPDRITTAGLLIFDTYSIEMQIHSYLLKGAAVYKVKVIVDYKNGGIDTWDEFEQRLVKTVSQIQWKDELYYSRPEAEAAVEELCKVYSTYQHDNNRNR